MEQSAPMHSNFLINSVLTGTSLTTGFISATYAEQLKQISLILTPFVQVCSIASFICFLIINRKTIREFFKKSKHEKI